MLVQSTQAGMPIQGEIHVSPPNAWLVTQNLIDGELYMALEPMWHNPLDYSFETAADMVEEGVIRIA
jgi:hypothetical protein